MNIIPGRKIEFRTKITQEEVLKRINDSHEYRGTTDQNSFKIYRIINYQNSFLPQIKGTVQSNSGDASVYVTMQLRKSVFIFSFVWIALALIFCSILKRSIPFSEIEILFNILPFVMPLMCLLITYVPFVLESRKSEKDLQRIFRGTDYLKNITIK